MKIAALVHIDLDFWARRRVLVTGHTGFKGAWLSLWLQSLGAELTGLATGVPTRPSLYELAGVGEHMRAHALDVRDARAVREAVAGARPEVVLHLAAQPMVRRSLREPALTYELNVMGTVNVLEAVRQAGEDVQAVVVVTSDKCYENPGQRTHRFAEDDPLGGADPYSSSKACAELVTSAYRRSFFSGDGPLLATARAGNVIGGGDWGEDRLVPDAVRAVQDGTALRVRNPHAVRPWQHVLSPLAGYLRLAEALSLGEPGAARAWNFGPPAHDERPVSWVVARLAELWEGELAWELDQGVNPPEAQHLALDSADAERELRWQASCDLDAALGLTVAWHRAARQGHDMREVSLAQIAHIGELDRHVGAT
ncbi:MAG TPA: CDP-glucose 4,6-dehydratase [Solirubrobacteraceae bacterium]|nr:CDP-glucose 4,6-dehydratase [Solirubrobacteraceae bacterium]